MPIVSIDAPVGLSTAEKKRLTSRINAAVTDAFGIADNVIFLREYAGENVAIAGELLGQSAAAEQVPANTHRASIASV